ncbi:MAG TPA: hypothetical protein VNZ54_06920 [bacterium]|nr:hypothetical protein [bacterium]
MANVPDVSSAVNSPLASLMASQAVQGPDLAARLGAAAFRMREEHRQEQVNDAEASGDSAVVSAEGHQSQEGAAPFRKKKTAPGDQGPTQGPGRTGSRIDMVA